MAMAILIIAITAIRVVQRIRLRGPLIGAIKHHDSTLALKLLRQGADPNSRDSGPHKWAFSDILNLLLHPGSSAKWDAEDATALQLAILNRERTVIHALVDDGADVNAMSGFWPIAFEGSKASLTITVIGGAKGSVTFDDDGSPVGYSALMVACGLEDVDTVHLLLAHGAHPNQHLEGEPSCLVLAIEDYSILLPDNVIRGSDGVATQSDGNQRVNSAAAIVRDLLDHGADASETVMHDRTALQVAMDSNWLAVMPLLQHGANANTHSLDPHGRPILMEAAAQSDAAVIRYLLDHGAEPNITNIEGRTALMELGHRYMSEEISLDALKLLLDHKADANARDKFGVTALMEAAGVGKKDSFSYGPSLEAMQLLIQHGAKVGLKAKDGRTVLERLRPTAKPGDSYGEAVVKLLKSAR